MAEEQERKSLLGNVFGDWQPNTDLESMLPWLLIGQAGNSLGQGLINMGKARRGESIQPQGLPLGMINLAQQINNRKERDEAFTGLSEGLPDDQKALLENSLKLGAEGPLNQYAKGKFGSDTPSWKGRYVSTSKGVFDAAEQKIVPGTESGSLKEVGNYLYDTNTGQWIEPPGGANKGQGIRYGKIGIDDEGNETYGWIDTKSGKLSPVMTGRRPGPVYLSDSDGNVYEAKDAEAIKAAQEGGLDLLPGKPVTSNKTVITDKAGEVRVLDKRTGKSELADFKKKDKVGLTEDTDTSIGMVDDLINRVTENPRVVGAWGLANRLQESVVGQLNPGAPQPARDFDKALEKLKALNLPQILQESGRSLSDADRQRMDKILSGGSVWDTPEDARKDLIWLKDILGKKAQNQGTNKPAKKPDNMISQDDINTTLKKHGITLDKFKELYAKKHNLTIEEVERRIAK